MPISHASLNGRICGNAGLTPFSIVLEEADETDLWIELAKRAGLVKPDRVQELQAEAVELIKIFNATRTSARNHKS